MLYVSDLLFSLSKLFFVFSELIIPKYLDYIFGNDVVRFVFIGILEMLSIYAPADPGAIRPCHPPIRSVNGTWPPAVKDFYHTKMAHNLVSVYSVLFQPHSISESITINSIHIIDLVYTRIITSSDFSLAPSLSMTYRTTSDHLLLFH